MTIEILQAEMISAMKAKDKFRKEVISTLVSAVKKAGIDNGCRENIPEDMVNATLLKEKKTMQEMIDTCPASRPDTLEEYKNKMSIIDEFVPKLITNEAEIDATIALICIENDIELIKKNRGAVMKAIMPIMKGEYDLNVVSKRVGVLLK